MCVLFYFFRKTKAKVSITAREAVKLMKYCRGMYFLLESLGYN